MCVVSMIMDHYRDEWERRFPPPYQTPPPYQPGIQWPYPTPPTITPQEVDEFRRLLERAREYDKRNNEPDCEMEEKRKAVREIAEKLGVKIDFV